MATSTLRENEWRARIEESDFGRIVDEYRPQLYAHCYRMLGSFHDAEDALQDALLRAWRGLSGFDSRSSLRTWLYRIATNACLDAMARRPKRVLPIDYGPPTSATADVGAPLVETVWIEPFPDEVLEVPDGLASPEARYEQREAVELAFIAALQHLPARQRAVLILREVLGFSAREVAETLDTSVASVNSALQRARRSLRQRLPERSQQATLRQLGDQRVKEVVDAYVEAWMRRDLETLRSLLAEDAVFSMPPWASWWRGRDEVMLVLAEGAEVSPPSRAIATRANAQPALGYYILEKDAGRYVPAAFEVITLDGPAIVEITAFITPDVFPAFGLPRELGPSAP